MRYQPLAVSTLSGKQHLIYQKWFQHTPSEGMGCYWQVLIIWKSDLSEKLKLDFSQAVAESILLYGCIT